MKIASGDRIKITPSGKATISAFALQGFDTNDEGDFKARKIGEVGAKDEIGPEVTYPISECKIEVEERV